MDSRRIVTRVILALMAGKRIGAKGGAGGAIHV